MSADPLAPVRVLGDAAGLLVDTSALDGAWADRHRPAVHLAVIGRRSVGKSRLVNRLVGQARRPGRPGRCHPGSRALRGPWRHPLGHAPPRDPVRRGWLARLLPSLDAVVWLIDGLQPMTGTERTILDRHLPAAVGVHIRTTRLDLVDPAEHDAILDRVARLTEGRHRLSLGPTAPRGDGPVPDILDVDPTGSPRRRRALRHGIDPVARSLDHLLLPPDPARLAREGAEAWREGVRGALDAVIAEAALAACCSATRPPGPWPSASMPPPPPWASPSTACPDRPGDRPPRQSYPSAVRSRTWSMAQPA